METKRIHNFISFLLFAFKVGMSLVSPFSKDQWKLFFTSNFSSNLYSWSFCLL